MPTKLKPGIYDLAAADYHALPHLSRSTIHTLLTKSPAHAKMGMSDEANGAMRLGTVWHKIVLGKGDEYAVSPFDEYRTNEAKAWVKEQTEAGLVPIKRKEFDIAQAMAERLHEQLGHHELGDVFGMPGDAEQTIIWQEGKVWCRALLDWLPEDRHSVVDLKSTECASTDAFQRVAFSHGYHLQAYWYARGLAAVTGQDVREIPFRFIVQESAPPHFINVIEMDGESLFMAEEQVERGIRVWDQCSRTGKWPSYGHRINGIDPPAYLIKKWEMDKALDEMERVA